MLGLLQLILLLIICIFFYLIVYQQLIKPALQMQFYRQQGIQCEFKPLAGSFPQDSDNVLIHGDYYHDWVTNSLQKKRTKLFCRNVGSLVTVILTDSQLIKEMFINKDNFIKHPFQNALVKRLSPCGLVLSEGALWKKHRLLISKGFEYGVVDSHLEKVQKISKKFVGQMSQNTTIQNVFNFFKEVAGNIISLIYFQQDISELRVDGKTMPAFLSDLIADLTRQSCNWKYFIFGMNLVDLQIFQVHRRLLRNISIMKQTVRQILLKHLKLRKQSDNSQFSMWNIFLNEANPSQGFSHDEIIDQFITFFSDGVYTTGHFMMMLTYNLAKYPEWKCKLRQQLKINLQNVQIPTQALINRLPILTACSKQTLRLMPPVVTGIERIAKTDTLFTDGTKIKKDSMVMACHLVNHIDPALHDDPMVFNPERWLTPESKTLNSVKNLPGCFIPFSIGDRRCPGQKFAMVEAAIFLSQFLTKYQYEIVDEKHYELKFTQRFLRQPLEPFGYHLTQI